MTGHMEDMRVRASQMQAPEGRVRRYEGTRQTSVFIRSKSVRYSGRTEPVPWPALHKMWILGKGQREV